MIRAGSPCLRFRLAKLRFIFGMKSLRDESLWAKFYKALIIS